MSRDHRELTPLTAISPLDGRYWERTHELSPFFSESALITTRMEIEIKYLLALSKHGLVRALSKHERKGLEGLIELPGTEQIQRIKELEKITRHDVKAIEKGLREFLTDWDMADVLEKIHYGLTSEDINNLVYRLMLSRACQEVVVPQLDALTQILLTEAEKYREVPMLARTHGQPAVPTTLGKEFANFAYRLNTQVRKLASVKLTGKLNGAVGNFNALALTEPDTDWLTFSQEFVSGLGLEPTLISTQINYADDIVELLQILHRVNTAVLNMAVDMWQYISDDWFTQEIKAGEVGSSTMPQKVNPIDFENARGNLETANALLEGFSRNLPISWLQRDLAMSTTIRNIGVSVGHSVLAYKSMVEGLRRAQPNHQVITEALNENWAILGEAVQTLLRKAGVDDPYTLVAGLTKGGRITEADWQAWVAQLEAPEDIKQTMQSLTPETYVGYAPLLVDWVIENVGESARSK